MRDEQSSMVPVSGRRLTLPEGPIFNLLRADQSHYEIGEFRAWAGYKNLGSDHPTNDLVHFQHVLSFAGTEVAGRTGVHVHLAHAHIVIPTSGRGVFSYDGVVTEAAPGSVIVQHGGTVHDQFFYTHAAGSEAQNRKTPSTIERPPADAPPRSFSFLELFVPRIFANVEIVPPDQVTPADQATAWAHPYHLPGAGFHLQEEAAPEAAWRPVAGRPDLEVRDCGTWGPSAGLVATWFLRPASDVGEGVVAFGLPGETGGIDIVHVIAGSAGFRRQGQGEVVLGAGDTVTFSQGLLGAPDWVSSDMRLVWFHISAKAEGLRERTPEEIQRLEALGAGIITAREVRPPGDTRPINVLQSGGGPSSGATQDVETALPR